MIQYIKKREENIASFPWEIFYVIQEKQNGTAKFTWNETLEEQ